MNSDCKQKARLYGKVFRFITAVIALTFLFSSTTTTYASANGFMNVTVNDNGRTYELSTKSREPEQILKEAGLRLSANDELDLDAFNPDEGGTIAIERAKTVRVVDDSNVVYCIGYNTVSDTLEEHGFGESDGYTTDADPMEDVFNGMQVIITRAFPVTVVADGEEQQLYTTGSTVANILEEAGVEVGEQDDVNKDLDREIESSSVITVDRVEYIERIETVEIPYETETINTFDLFEGEREIETSGTIGKKEVTYKDKIVNGEVVSSEIVAEETEIEPTNEVVKIGSKKRATLVAFRDGVEPISDLEVPSYVKLDKNGLPKRYVDYYEGRATAYTGDSATASGRIPKQGIVAVDPKKFPYGSELFIVSLDGQYVYGYCIAGDTGGFVKTTNNIADLYMDTEEMCIDWGARNVAIYVISYAK